MRNKRQVIFFAPLLLAVTMGSTDCEYFSETVVPASDPTPPVAYDGVWRGSEFEVVHVSGATGLTYHIQPGQKVVAIASAIDPEGLRKLTVSTDWGRRCCQGNICSVTSSLSIPFVETQPGTVGSTVST